MDLSPLFREHIAKMTSTASRTLSEAGFDALVLGAGSQMLYYADDMNPLSGQTRTSRVSAR